jgi:hypothetical protein
VNIASINVEPSGSITQLTPPDAAPADPPVAVAEPVVDDDGLPPDGLLLGVMPTLVGSCALISDAQARPWGGVGHGVTVFPLTLIGAGAVALPEALRDPVGWPADDVLPDPPPSPMRLGPLTTPAVTTPASATLLAA